MAHISEYLAPDLSADAIGRINIRNMYRVPRVRMKSVRSEAQIAAK